MGLAEKLNGRPGDANLAENEPALEPSTSAAIRPAPSLQSILERAKITGSGDDEVLTFSRSDFMDVIRAFVALVPFDRDLYLAHYPGFRELEETGKIASVRMHWLNHGYFEGRLVYGWETLPFDIVREQFGAPDAYFTHLRAALLAECFEEYDKAEAHFRAAISSHKFSLGACVGLARLHFKTRNLVACDAVLRQALTIDPTCKVAAQIMLDVSISFKQTDRAIALAQYAESDSHGVRHVVRVLNLGRVGEARRLINRATGDWITIAGAKKAIEGRWVEVRRLLRIFIGERKVRRLSLKDEALICRYLASLGWRSMALRMLEKLVLSPSAGETSQAYSAEFQVIALEILRICDGISAAMNLLHSNIQFSAQRDATFLNYRILLAHEANNMAEVIETSVINTSFHQSSAALEMVAFALIRSGRVVDALDICRSHWSATGRYPWIPEAVLFARRVQGAYVGLSFKRNAAQPGATKIPKVIMQFWDDPTPPDDVVVAMRTWAVNNPGYSHIWFSNERAREFLHAHYGSRHVTLFDHCHHPAMKADFFRLAYLAACGGIYVDADEASREPLDVLLMAHPTKDLFLCLAPDAYFVSNGFIACIPAHPIIARTLHNAVHALECSLAGNTKADIWVATGPQQLTLSVAEAMLDDGGSLSTDSTGFLYWHTRGRFSEIRELAYKQTVNGNWRARPWEQSATP